MSPRASLLYVSTGLCEGIICAASVVGSDCSKVFCSGQAYGLHPVQDRIITVRILLFPRSLAALPPDHTPHQFIRLP